jgi:hypothetical protein
VSVAVEVAEQEAARAARGLAADGYRADFTIAGLAEVDRFLDDHAPSGVPAPGGRLAEHTGGRLFAIAAYVGEVVRRELGGTWRHRPGAEADPTAVEVVLPGGRVIEPVEWVFHRLKAQPPGGVHRLAWLLLDHRVLAPADGRSWVAPSEAVERLRAAVPGVREDDAAAIHLDHPLTTMMRTSGIMPPEVLEDVERQLARVRYVTVADTDTGRSVELTPMPGEAIAVHHPPALTPLVEACGRALGYTVARMDLPPITLPTASPPPSPPGWWGKVRRFLGLGSRPTASREENEQ